MSDPEDLCKNHDVQGQAGPIPFVNIEPGLLAAKSPIPLRTTSVMTPTQQSRCPQRRSMKHCSRVWLIAVSMALIGACVHAQVDPKLYSDMKWREIGPMRAGRTRALAGVPSEPATFYLGAVNGGVWKTTDAGATWHSVWDDQPSGSIGSIAVSLSDPNTIYAGSGEGLQRPDLSTGDGVYKSTDAGKTWTHLEALRDGQQIGQIAIDPRDANRVFVAVEGHPVWAERGARALSHGGWRQDLQARAVCEQQDGRL